MSVSLLAGVLGRFVFLGLLLFFLLLLLWLLRRDMGT